MNLLLFSLCSIIWGSTWIAIKHQLGQVDPMVSILYRFFIAVAILLGYCLADGRRLRFSAKDHQVFFLTGVFMFSGNYWLVYTAEKSLTSGLVAIVFSTMIFLNAVNNRIFLKAPIVPKIIWGGGIGVTGLCLIFYRELGAFTFKSDTMTALGLALIASLSASFGNTTAQVCHRRNIPTIQMALFGMGYGSLFMGSAALITGTPFTFDPSPSYIVSLFYLGVVGSVVAFMGYLTLLKNIGSDKTAYITLVTPLVALAVSTLFEGYTWSVSAVAGVGLIVLGNWIALRKKAARVR
jgi:drug/metabolite transporter (DMT)-like permease